MKSCRVLLALSVLIEVLSKLFEVRGEEFDVMPDVNGYSRYLKSAIKVENTLSSALALLTLVPLEGFRQDRNFMTKSLTFSEDIG